MQPRNIWRVSRLLLLLILGLTSCSTETPVAPKQVPKVTVSKPMIKEKEVDFDEYNGWVVAKEPVEIRSRVRGFVKEIHFKDPMPGRPGEGELVKKGDPLFDLEPDEFQDRIVEAEQKVEVYRAQKAADEKELVRLTELEKKGSASKSQVDKAEADVKSLNASINAALAEVKQRQRDLNEYSKIKSPIDGRIGRSLVSKGELVKQGDTLLTTINSIDPIKVMFYMDEQAIQRRRRIALGNSKDGKLPVLKEAKIPFRFALDTDEDFGREGIIDFADNQTDSKTGKILVRGETPNPSRLLIPGDHVRVKVPLGEPYRALLVPDTAVNSDQDKKYLLVLDDKDVVQRRDVRLGKLADHGLRVVETNLNLTDRVIIEGTQRARIGFPAVPEEKDVAEEMKRVAGRAGQ